MNRRNAAIAAIAIVLGLFAVYIANAWFSGVEQRQERVAEEQRLVRVAVAGQDMAFGTTLTPDNVKLVNWPADSVPQGAFQQADVQRLVSAGNVAIRPIAAGEPILLSRISERAVLSANLPADMRAVTVPVDAVAGVAGFVTPGDMVDVLLTRALPGDEGGQQTHPVLKGVQVLAIDLRASENETEPNVGRTATLQVSPVDAQKLVLATQVGRLSLALRNVEDTFSGSTRTITTADLGGYYRARRSAPAAASAPRAARTVTSVAAVSGSAPAVRAVPSGPTMTVVRGTAVTDEEVQRYGS